MSVKESIKTRGKSRSPAVPEAPAAETKATPTSAFASPPTVGSDNAETLTKRLHRLAIDVHDGPMQNLAVIGFSLGDLRRRVLHEVPPEHQTGLDEGLEKITDELGRVEHDLRALIGALEHNSVELVPLRDAIESEIVLFQRRSDATVAFSFDDAAVAETDSQRIALQFVTRAALANVTKHAGATRVAVRLTAANGVTAVEIEDNGRGFRADLPPKRGRMGLTGMRRRVELLGGSFAVASRIGGPTIIRASLHAWRPEEG
jgi:signal transduction histidine kinase